MADDASVDGRTEDGARSPSTRTGRPERDVVPPDDPKREAVSAADPDSTESTAVDQIRPPGPSEATDSAAEPLDLADSTSSSGAADATTMGDGSGSAVDDPSLDEASTEEIATSERSSTTAEIATTEQSSTDDTTTETTDAAEASSAATTGKKKTKKRGSFWKELPILLVVAFGLAMLIKTFLVQAFFIPSGSMEQTLHGCPGCSGDRVLVDKVTYRFRDPKPGEIVVFRAPDSWASEVPATDPGNFVQRFFRSVGQAVGLAEPNEKDVIKRVIAVGGQTVRCCDDQGRVVVDGVALDEPYVFDEGTPPTPFGPVEVPEGRLWVMGDHRNQSGDSRVHVEDPNQGTISEDDVIGKAFVIAWPPSRWDTLGTPETFHNLATRPAALATPYALGLVGAVPVMGVRRRWRRRRSRAG